MHWIHERRLRWLFDLVDPDPVRRRAARLRYDRHIGDWSEALHHSNAALWSNGQSYDFSQAPALGAAFERHEAEREAALENTIYKVVGRFYRASWSADQTATYELLAPYAVLFLRWENAYPVDWRDAAPWSPWGRKQRILRSFVRAGVPAPHRAQLVELVTQAVSREQRCEDGWYAALARRLDGPELRAALEACQTSTDRVVRLRAGYVLAVLNDLEMPVAPPSWRRWLAQAAAVAPM